MPHNRLIRFIPGALSGDPVRFHCDEDVNLDIVPMLRERGIDMTTSPEVGLLRKSDLEQLRFAARERRVLITNDALHFPSLAVMAPHAGVLVCHGGGRFPVDVFRRCLELAGRPYTEEKVDPYSSARRKEDPASPHDSEAMRAN